MYIRDEHFMDIAVVDQQSCLTRNADAWPQFVPDPPYKGPENTVAAYWFLTTCMRNAHALTFTGLWTLLAFEEILPT
jgi:hypothetical protein